MKTLIFDWDGTIARNEVDNEAAIRRLKMLNIEVTKEWIKQAQKTHAHYKVTKDAISKYAGVTDDRLLTIMMVNLFQINYLSVVNELKEKSIFSDFVKYIKEIKTKYNLKFVLVSTLFKDLIIPALEILNLKELFDYVYANTSDLKYRKIDLVNMIPKSEKPILMIGDRREDMEAAKSLGIKSAFVTWGQEDCQEFSNLIDFIIKKPEDIKTIISKVI